LYGPNKAGNSVAGLVGASVAGTIQRGQFKQKSTLLPFLSVEE
jgi:hypothetical protein